jgi:flagellar basal-body rod modification protein FlgD
MSVNPVSSLYKTAAASSEQDPGAGVKKKTTLGQEDFLKLLAVQFQSQDPMKPMEDTAFIAQMAQFTSLEQSSSLVQQMMQLQTAQDVTTANSYIGRRVTLDGGNDEIVTGEVSGVDISDGTPRLIVGDYTYPISSVLLVEPGSTAAPSTTPNPTNS